MSKYRKLNIILTKEERSELESVVRKGNSGAMEIRRANVLLMADRGEGHERVKDVDIAKALGITIQAIHDIKVRFLERKGGEERIRSRESVERSGRHRQSRQRSRVMLQPG